MIRVLALDTSSNWGGVAIVEQDEADGPTRVVAEAGFHARDHARHLMSWIDALIREAGLSREAIDAFVGVRGPGSFAGLRIGMGTLRGLAVASGKPCFGVGTLAAMAEAFGPAEAVRVPLLPAGRGEIFGASYDPASSPPQESTPPMVGPPGVVLEACVVERPAVVFGFGLDEAAVPDVSGVRRAAAPRGIAAAAARLVLLEKPAEGSVSPLYLRPPDARLPR